MGITFSLENLAQKIGGTVQGNGSTLVTGVAPLDSAKRGDLTFLTNPRYARQAQATQASAILCEKALPGVSTSFLLAPNPYAALAKVISLFFPPKKPSPGVMKGAWVDPKASVHPEARVAEGVYVSAGAKLGARSVLYPGVYIGENAVIGDDCLLYPNSVVREDCVLGQRVILQPGAVVGSDGFGFAPDGGQYRKIPQVGNVVVEDDVELGANVCVDRAVLGTTRIGRGCKLDNLIQVGHNVVIGEHTVIAGLTGIAGSVEIGKHVVIGGQAGLAGHLKVANNVVLAGGTGVTQDIPDPGVYWGMPAIDISTERKNLVAYQRLYEMAQRVRKLEKALENLQVDGKKGGSDE